MTRRHSILCAAGWIAALLPAAPAQSTFPFQLQFQQDSGRTNLSNNASVTVRGTGIGQLTRTTLIVLYTGSVQVTMGEPQIRGSADFTISRVEGAPPKLAPGGSFAVVIQYAPSTGQSAAAQLTIPWLEAAGTGASGNITLSLTGVAANLAVYYSLPTNGNVTPLPSDGTLEFPDTAAGSSVTATIVVSNQGTSQGTVTSAAVSGEAFRLVQLPLLPGTVNAGATLSFGIRYSPKTLGSDAGWLTIQLGTQRFTAALRGSGAGAVFSYSLLSDRQSLPVSPGGTIPFPDTAVSETAPVVLQIRNTGNASGTIAALTLSGTIFRLAEAPPFPLTLPAGGATQVTVKFSPAQAGASTGRLFVGSDYFDLAGIGIAPSLAYAYSVSGAVTAIQPAGTVLFSPTALGQSAAIDFIVTNQGTSAAQITSIGIAGSGSGAFRLTQTPALPASVGPGQSLAFPVVFAPVAVSQATATLLVNTQVFTLLGFGTGPPKLPAYQIAGPGGQVAPYSQPAVSLALSEPYSLPLRGTLALTGDSVLAGLDPAVQFSTGGRSVAFAIPAGETQAVFANGLGRVQLQTGTVSGTITLTASFSTASGVDVTPANPSGLTMAVSSQPPVLLSAQVSSRSAASFTVVVTGYSTARSLSTLEFQFTGAAGVGLNGARLTVDLSQAAGTWFSSPGSQAYGGLFSATIPFTLQGSGSATLIENLKSFSVTAANSLGTSAALSGLF